MNVALIGYRGTGKTAIAALAAKGAGLALKNLDGIIVDRAGVSIPEFVAMNGWPAFRDLESQVLAELAGLDNQLLDCGGGIVLRERNRQVLKAVGHVIWLTAAVPVIISRISHDTNRPSLTGKSFTDEVAEVLAEREPLYRECATSIIATDQCSPEKAAQEILKQIGK